MSQSTELMINIDVQDGASPKFKAIGQAAQNMGAQAEQSGGRAGGAFRRLQDAAKNNAMAIGLLTGSFGLFARATRDAERDLLTLDRTYGNTADSLRDFGDELQRTTTFSNEQAIEAANLFGTLSRNYGLTADEIKNLIAVSADLAAVNGITLEDAAQRVQAAIRGEAESAEALGLTMNETAIGLDKVSAGMSEAEKAAFRYDKLLQQAAFATGAAAEQADTTAGRFKQLTNSVQDVGQDFVRFTGPVGQAVAGLSDASLEVGMAASGFMALAPAIKTVITAVGGLSTALGPIGLALAAGAAILGIAKLVGGTDDYTQSATKAEQKTLDLIGKIQSLALTSIAGSTQQREAVYLNDILEKYGTNLVENTVSAQDAAKALLDYGDAAVASSVFIGRLDENTANLVQTTQAYQNAVNDAESPGVITYEETLLIVDELNAGYGALVDGAGSAVDAINLTNQVMTEAANAGVNQADVLSLVTEAWRDFELSGDWDKLVTTLETINTDLQSVEVTTAQTNQRMLDLQATMTKAWTAAMDPLAGVDDLLTGIFSSMAPGAYEAQQAINGTTGAAEELGRAMAEANGSPIAREGAIRQFYDTASAIEILNYELILAGNNQEKINEAYRMFAIRVRESNDAINEAEWAITRNHNLQNAALDDQQAQMLESGRAAADYTYEINAGSAAIAHYHAGLDALNDPLAAQQRQMEANGRAAADYGAGMDEAAQATAEAEQAFLAAALELSGLNDSLTMLNTIGAGQGTEGIGRGLRVNIMQAAVDATNSINALNESFQVLVQNPIQWGRESQAVADWATSVLLGAEGVNSLSDLWGRGQIETRTYTRGIEAQNRILDANAEIQNDVARIQAKQLPIMADLIEQQAEYIDGIADLDPKNQVAALGFMDVGKAAQAQSLMMLAAQGAAAGFGSGIAQMSEQIIVAAAQSDPVLKAMLEDMGLIREGAEGEIVVNFARAQGLNNDLQRLIASIDALVVALGGIPAHTEAVVDVYYNVNGRPALPGQIGFSQFATGGTVTHRVASATPMFATAATGRTTLVGEAGPELVTLPTGSQVTSSPATMDRMRSRPMQGGGGGGVYFYGPVTLQPASTDVESAIRREALSGSRGY